MYKKGSMFVMLPFFVVLHTMIMKLKLILLFVVTPLLAISQFVSVNAESIRAYNYILSLRINEATEIIIAQKENNTENVYIDYLESFNNFIKITVSNDERLFNDLKPQIEDCIDKLYSIPDTTPWKRYLIGNLKLQIATLDFNFGNYVSGALNMNKAYRLLTSNNDAFPDFIPNYISLGVLHVMIGLVPDSYKWILDFIDMNGDITMGINELNKAYNHSLNNSSLAWTKNEILFYSGMIGINIIPDKSFADTLLARLDTNNSSNLLNSYLKINILMKSGKNNEALNVFKDISDTIDFYPFYYMNLLKGECYLRKLLPAKSRTELLIFTSNYKGDNYIKDAWLKIGWSYFLEGDTTAYLDNRKNILEDGNNKTGNDQEAQNKAMSNELPCMPLLKARLLFDGGYYEQAINILLKADTSHFSKIELVELYYRLGRIYHQMGNTINSLENYKITIKTGSNLPQYYAANAALKSAYIYENMHDTVSAVYYYNICLDLDFKEYRTSIRTKAKQGIKRLNKDN